MMRLEFEKPSLIKGVCRYVPTPGSNAILVTDLGETILLNSLGLNVEVLPATMNVSGGTSETVRYKFASNEDYEKAKKALVAAHAYKEEGRERLAF